MDGMTGPKAGVGRWPSGVAFGAHAGGMHRIRSVPDTMCDG